MGINTHYYTVYGVKIDYNDDLGEALDEVWDELQKEDDLAIIADAMGGEYMVIGKILFDSGDLRFNDFKDSFEVISNGELPIYRIDVTNAFSRLFHKFTDLLDGDWNLMTFVHYS